MTHQARKYILVPEDRYKRMLTMMNREGIRSEDDIDKAVTQITEESVPDAVLSRKELSDRGNNNKQILDDILDYFPKNMKSRARLISSYLNKSGDYSSWNSNGEIILNGEVIRGSSLTDLLYDACCPSRKYEPIGLIAFYEILRKNNIPMGFIRNKGRRVFLRLGSLEDNDRKNKSNKETNKFTWRKY